MYFDLNFKTNGFVHFYYEKYNWIYDASESFYLFSVNFAQWHFTSCLIIILLKEASLSIFICYTYLQFHLSPSCKNLKLYCKLKLLAIQNWVTVKVVLKKMILFHTVISKKLSRGEKSWKVFVLAMKFKGAAIQLVSPFSRSWGVHVSIYIKILKKTGARTQTCFTIF